MNSSFEALGVSPKLCQRLARHNIVTPTPIQAGAIPVASAGHDLVGIAQTGTGKTLAFGLPIRQRLNAHSAALVLAPTRELAQQIAESLRVLDLRCCLVIGGAPMHRQVSDMRRRPEVIVATPGRLIDHMQQGSAELGRVSIVVLDEADRMLDMGFAPAIRQILDGCPPSRQTLLFSATMPDAIRKLADEYLVDPETIEVARPGEAASAVRQELEIIAHEQKRDRLADRLHETEGPALVFVRTRHGARKLAKVVKSMGFKSVELHSDRTLSQRRTAMEAFKSGAARVLVATDIAARGIDVKDITLVVNYDVPEQADDYVHRIGRTGRAGSSGLAVTFALPQQQRDVREIEKLMGQRIPRLGEEQPERVVAAVAAATAPRVAVVREDEVRQERPARKPANRKGSTPKPNDRDRKPSDRKFADRKPVDRKPSEDQPRRFETDSARPARPEGKGRRHKPKLAPSSSAPAQRKGHRGWSGRPNAKRSGGRRAAQS